jgi:hypothetical protein
MNKLILALVLLASPASAADLRVRVPPAPMAPAVSIYRPAIPALTAMPQVGIILQPMFPQVTTHTLWPTSWYPATGRTVWCPSVGVYAHCF